MCVCVTGIAERTMTSMGPISNARFSRNDLSCHFASLCHAAVSYRKVSQSFFLSVSSHEGGERLDSHLLGPLCDVNLIFRECILDLVVRDRDHQRLSVVRPLDEDGLSQKLCRGLHSGARCEASEQSGCELTKAHK